MNTILRISILLASISLLFACSSASRIDHIPSGGGGPRDLVVFFDGTANDEGSHTNIIKLHSLVSLQSSPRVSTTYVQGVGTGSRVIGMAMGWGIGNDVRDAYLYLIENYHADTDRVSIFGFSRGAYAARILSSLLYVAGIPEARRLSEKDREKLVDDIYSAYKSKRKTIPERRAAVANMLENNWGAKLRYRPLPVNVRFLGLWDTVEALGWPDYSQDIDEPNTRYADQLCNIEAAAHALSIDDDRARIFTPLLLSRKHLREELCDKGSVDNSGKINEVWFSGAHSDVGGGYKDTDIDGVSLNWMLDKIEEHGLNIVPDGAAVYADYLGETHDPEAGLFGLIYRKRTRDIPCYTAISADDGSCDKENYDETSTPMSSPLNVHRSVLDRLCHKSPKDFESFWFEAKKYQHCLLCDDQSRGVLSDADRCQKNINVINNKRYAPPAPRDDIKG